MGYVYTNTVPLNVLMSNFREFYAPKKHKYLGDETLLTFQLFLGVGYTH